MSLRLDARIIAIVRPRTVSVRALIVALHGQDPQSRNGQLVRPNHITVDPTPAVAVVTAVAVLAAEGVADDLILRNGGRRCMEAVVLD